MSILFDDINAICNDDKYRCIHNAVCLVRRLSLQNEKNSSLLCKVMANTINEILSSIWHRNVDSVV